VYSWLRFKILRDPPTNIFKRKEKPKKIKEKANLSGWQWKGWQGFLKKYYPTTEGGDFFKNP
jgi:hypothetical protein